MKKALLSLIPIACVVFVSVTNAEKSPLNKTTPVLPKLGVQFMMQIGAPYPVNMQQVKRTVLFKWEYPPKMSIEGPKGVLVDAKPLIDGAIFDLSTHYKNAPELTNNPDTADIRMVFFDSTKKDMILLLENIVDSSLSDYWNFDEMVTLAEIDATNLPYSYCSVHLFDRETDLNEPDPFAVVLIDYSHPDYRVERLKKQCLYEEIGHATTFFADIPKYFTMFETDYEFDTIYIASSDVRSHHDVFTSDDLALLAVLNNPKLKNGMPTHEATDLGFELFGFNKEKWQ